MKHFEILFRIVRRCTEQTVLDRGGQNSRCRHRHFRFFCFLYFDSFVLPFQWIAAMHEQAPSQSQIWNRVLGCSLEARTGSGVKLIAHLWHCVQSKCGPASARGWGFQYTSSPNPPHGERVRACGPEPSPWDVTNGSAGSRFSHGDKYPTSSRLDRLTTTGEPEARRQRTAEQEERSLPGCSWQQKAHKVSRQGNGESLTGLKI